MIDIASIKLNKTLQIKHLIKTPLLLLLFITLFSHYSDAQSNIDSSKVKLEKELKASLSNINSTPNQSYRELSQLLTTAKSKYDSINTIKCLIGLSDIDRFRGNYETAFDNLWEAQLNVSSNTPKSYIITINRNLGILYNIFNKEVKALQHFEYALRLAKEIENDHFTSQIISTYFSIATLYMDKKQYDIAFSYLDSCSYNKPKDKHLPYVDANKGYIYLQFGRYHRSKTHLYKSLQYLGKNEEKYKTVIYSFLGDLKVVKEEVDSALFYYHKSLDIMESYGAYVEIKPELYLKISEIYKQKGLMNKAYSNLLASTHAADSLFNLTNKRNQNLFEVKNRYKETINKREDQINAQNLIIKSKNSSRLQWQLISLLLILSGFVVYLRYRHQSKIKNITVKQELEKEKSNAILELKNKDLTSNALQMLEKEQAVNELLNIIKQDLPLKYKELQHKHLNQKKNLWNDFDVRFKEINDRFYEELQKKHPELTFTEQKHCALIKLNFDSNEMAQILNISLQSVHTSRYRIRKKIGLAHEEKLSTYMTNIGGAK